MNWFWNAPFPSLSPPLVVDAQPPDPQTLRVDVDVEEEQDDDGQEDDALLHDSCCDYCWFQHQHQRCFRSGSYFDYYFVHYSHVEPWEVPAHRFLVLKIVEEVVVGWGL